MFVFYSGLPHTVDRKISSLINFHRYPTTMKIKNTKNFQHRIIRMKLHFRYAEVTKIKQRENLTDKYFYEQKFPAIRYNCLHSLCLSLSIASPGARSAASIIVRGANDFMVDEMERSLHDALCVVKRVLESNQVVPGGGAVETALSIYLENFATSIVSQPGFLLFQLVGAFCGLCNKALIGLH